MWICLIQAFAQILWWQWIILSSRKTYSSGVSGQFFLLRPVLWPHVDVLGTQKSCSCTKVRQWKTVYVSPSHHVTRNGVKAVGKECLCLRAVNMSPDKKETKAEKPRETTAKWVVGYLFLLLWKKTTLKMYQTDVSNLVDTPNNDISAGHKKAVYRDGTLMSHFFPSLWINLSCVLVASEQSTQEKV